MNEGVKLAGGREGGGKPTGKESVANPDADVDPTDGRDETENERMDRNWNEILQELRVTQTGTQILTGFLLTIAFQPKFADLSTFQHSVYLILVVASGLTTALGLTPVYLHRGLFRSQRKAVLVRLGHVIMRCALGGIAVVLIGTQLLIFDVVIDRTAGLIAAAAALLVVTAIGVLPPILKAITSRAPSP